MVVADPGRRGFLARPSGKFLVLVAVLVLGTTLGRTSARDSIDASALRADIRRVSDAVAALALDVEALRREARGADGANLAAPSSPTARTTAIEEPDVLAALARLEALVRELDGRPGGASAPRPSPVPGRASILEIRGALERVPDHEYSALDDVLSAEHLLWSVEDVVARYGMPVRTETQQSSPVLFYDLDDDRDAAREPPWVSFETIAGRVTRVRVMPGKWK